MAKWAVIIIIILSSCHILSSSLLLLYAHTYDSVEVGYSVMMMMARLYYFIFFPLKPPSSSYHSITSPTWFSFGFFHLDYVYTYARVLLYTIQVSVIINFHNHIINTAIILLIIPEAIFAFVIISITIIITSHRHDIIFLFIQKLKTV